MTQILDRRTNEVIAKGDVTLLRLVEKNKAYLGGADLGGAKIEFPRFPSIRTLSSIPLRNISDEIILELMRWDAQAHPHPELFNTWAAGSDCPYQKEERWWYMPEKREVWKPGPPEMKLSDLILEICRQEGGGHTRLSADEGGGVMAVAKCTQCGERVVHRQQRGFRLKDMRCPKCGGVMKKAQFSSEAYERFIMGNSDYVDGRYLGDSQTYYKAVYL